MTRAKSQAGYLTGLLDKRVFEAIEIPVSEIVPLPLGKAGQKLVAKADEYDWLVFNSSNGVQLFMGHWKKLKKNIRRLSKVKIACAGEATAKTLRSFGLKSDLVPKDFHQEGLARAFNKMALKGKRILLCRAQEGRDVLYKSLKKKNVKVARLTLYKNRIPAGSRNKLQHLFTKGGSVDLLTFTSSSAVNHFYGSFTAVQRKMLLKAIPVAVIGPVTANSVRKWGMKVAVQPTTFTMPAFAMAISAWARKSRQRVI